MVTTKDDMKEIVGKARATEFENHGVTENKDNGHQLVGWCHHNVLTLCKEMAYQGKWPTLIWGYVVEEEDEGEPPASIEEMEKRGRTHYWVEWEDYVLDISKHPTGEMFVGKELPENYGKVEGSEIEYDERIKDDMLLNSAGWEYLNELGLVTGLSE